MTTIKLLSAGAIAIALLATPAMARENYLIHRNIAGEAHTSISSTGRYIDGGAHILSLRVKALPAIPDGGSCDVGDTPYIC